MAKRRRLSPALLDATDPGAPPGAPPPADLAVLDRPSPPPRPPAATPARAPIAAAAGEAAARGALDEIAREMQAMREEGRLVEAIALDQVEAEHLMRDRLVVEEGEMGVLLASLRAHGQRTPIEVTPIEGAPEGASGGAARYGLISGWRRLSALRRLHAETGEARFACVRALVRRPRDAAEAYVAMVEENEVRAQLSHYERARLVARAADAGVFDGEDAALRALFGAASPPRRSKIKAFVPIHRSLGAHLRHPEAIPERLGLALAKALRADPGLAGRLAPRLGEGLAPEAELACLQAAASGTLDATPTPVRRGGGAGGEEIRPGIILRAARGGGGPALVLSGPGVDAGLRARLAAWLRATG